MVAREAVAGVARTGRREPSTNRKALSDHRGAVRYDVVLRLLARGLVERGPAKSLAQGAADRRLPRPRLDVSRSVTRSRGYRDRRRGRAPRTPLARQRPPRPGRAPRRPRAHEFELAARSWSSMCSPTLPSRSPTSARGPGHRRPRARAICSSRRWSPLKTSCAWRRMTSRLWMLPSCPRARSTSSFVKTGTAIGSSPSSVS